MNLICDNKNFISKACIEYINADCQTIKLFQYIYIFVYTRHFFNVYNYTGSVYVTSLTIFNELMQF